MQDNYSFLLKVYERVVEQLKDGERLCDVYNAAVQLVEAERPELKDHFTRNAGYVSVQESFILLHLFRRMIFENGECV